jgi:hypothetical protein
MLLLLSLPKPPPSFQKRKPLPTLFTTPSNRPVIIDRIPPIRINGTKAITNPTRALATGSSPVSISVVLLQFTGILYNRINTYLYDCL